jgi:hypothetical protein
LAVRSRGVGFQPSKTWENVSLDAKIRSVANLKATARCESRWSATAFGPRRVIFHTVFVFAGTVHQDQIARIEHSIEIRIAVVRSQDRLDQEPEVRVIDAAIARQVVGGVISLPAELVSVGA